VLSDDVRSEVQCAGSSESANQRDSSAHLVLRQIAAHMSEVPAAAELCVFTSSPGIAGSPERATLTPATSPSAGQKRGPVPRRRFQKGCFVIEADGRMYSMHYVDADGKSKRIKRFLGSIERMSERAARREHARIMEDVNRTRVSLAPVYRGQTFTDAVNKWRKAIAPNLSPATVRQRESYLKVHILPRFGKSAPQELGVDEIQQFATDLRKKLSAKTIVNVLSAVFAILDYAERCGMKVTKVGFADLELGSSSQTEVPFFTRGQATQIIEAAPEPFKTLFALAWSTGLRAGEILALTLDDLDFNHKTIRVNKSLDDATREPRQPKTPKSIATLPMTSALEGKLRDYIQSHWKPNPTQILFPNRRGTRPRSRDNVVRVGLKPVLKELGIPSKNTGLHAFRHGLATELAEAAVPLTVLQNQLRHADVKTTLRVYSHVIPQTQRDAMEQVGGFQLVRETGTVLKFARK
jgi:integrase